MGRPLKPIDGEQVEYLASIGCTQEEIAEFFGCASHSTISERFRHEFNLGRAQSKITLRKRQWNASKKSVPMLIHLGKVHLGQTDRIDVTSGGEQVKTVLHFEDNGFGAGNPGAGGPAA